MSKNNKDLCIRLLNAESEQEVIRALESEGYWKSDEAWQLLGGKENNFSLVGNQSEDPVAALVEKFVNAVDAVLMRECLIRGIDPESTQAPKSRTTALEEFFGVKKGNLANIDAYARTKLASNIGFVATGTRRSPNYTIFDNGEGQSPDRMPSTFLSLAETNKMRIPFVQGQFNQGGTAVLRFCGGESNLQLIISKRCPKVRENTNSNWGFTIVRRENPRDRQKSSFYRYLAPQGMILDFQLDELSVTESDKNLKEIPPLKWGTVIKLFEYEMPGGLKTDIKYDLYNQVSLLLPRVGLPIRFYERRDYSGHSAETTMSGLGVRLEDDKRDNLEDGFPAFETFSVDGEIFSVWIYAFKKGNAEKYRKREGILFSAHGQAHAIIASSFFTRTKVGMSYLADSLLVIVECDGLDPRNRELLFMNSRDRLSRGEFRRKIEVELESLINAHQGLRNLRERRQREAKENKLSENKPLKDILNQVIAKSKALQQLFYTGEDIKNPFKSKLVGEADNFDGKKHPTFFRLIPGQEKRQCHMGQRFRVQFETDADNDYFGRDIYPGKHLLRVGGNILKTSEYSLNLWNGVATLNVSLPAEAKENDELEGILAIEDETIIEPFKNTFIRTVLAPTINNGNEPGKRLPPSGTNNGDRQVPDDFALPPVIEIREADWNSHNFTKYSALEVINDGQGKYDFYVNMDNVYLLNEIKSSGKSVDPRVLETQYKSALALVGLALLSYKPAKDEIDRQETWEETIRMTTSAIAPILLPMIRGLGSLDIEDIVRSELVQEFEE